MANGEIPGTGGARFPAAPAMPSGPELGRAPGGDKFRDIRGRFAGGIGINWIGLDACIQMAKDLGTNVKLADKAQRLAEDIKAYAKENAPWEDHTGDAREGLDTEVVFTSKDDVNILLFHSVEYGVYLENANGGEFSIIIPTMEKFAAELESRMFGPGTK